MLDVPGAEVAATGEAAGDCVAAASVGAVSGDRSDAYTTTAAETPARTMMRMTSVRLTRSVCPAKRLLRAARVAAVRASRCGLRAAGTSDRADESVAAMRPPCAAGQSRAAAWTSFTSVVLKKRCTSSGSSTPAP